MGKPNLCNYIVVENIISYRKIKTHWKVLDRSKNQKKSIFSFLVGFPTETKISYNGSKMVLSLVVFQVAVVDSDVFKYLGMEMMTSNTKVGYL